MLAHVQQAGHTWSLLVLGLQHDALGGVVGVLQQDARVQGQLAKHDAKKNHGQESLDNSTRGEPDPVPRTHLHDRLERGELGPRAGSDLSLNQGVRALLGEMNDDWSLFSDGTDTCSSAWETQIKSLNAIIF